MVKASSLGRSLLAAVLIQTQHKAVIGAVSLKDVLQRWLCAIRATDGESAWKSDLSLCMASLGLILESLEGPGPVLFIKQQLTMHIL